MKDRDAGRWTFRRLFASLVTAAGLAGLCSGCAHNSQRTLNDFWSSVTPRQWSSRTPETPPEPRVSANVPDPEPVSQPQLPEHNEGSAKSEDLVRNWNPFAPRSRAPQPEPAPQAAPPLVEPAAPVQSELESKSALARLNPPSLQRLRTALTLGFESKAEPQPPAGPGQDQARLRVENLLTRSQELAETGDLSQARHLAELAQQMSRESQLEFAPDVQRPVDVIAFLDQRESAGDSNQPHVLTTAFASLVEQPAAAAVSTLSPPPPHALGAPGAVMHVNRGSLMPDNPGGHQSPPVGPPPADAPQNSHTDSGIELIPHAEPAADLARDLNGVAAVRKRFQSAERGSVPAPDESQNAVPLSKAEPRVTTPTAIAMSWTWPSLTPSRPQPQRPGSLPLAIALTAGSLAVLVAGGWMAAKRRRRRTTR